MARVLRIPLAARVCIPNPDVHVRCTRAGTWMFSQCTVHFIGASTASRCRLEIETCASEPFRSAVKLENGS